MVRHPLLLLLICSPLIAAAAFTIKQPDFPDPEKRADVQRDHVTNLNLPRATEPNHPLPDLYFRSPAEAISSRDDEVSKFFGKRAGSSGEAGGSSGGSAGEGSSSGESSSSGEDGEGSSSSSGSKGSSGGGGDSGAAGVIVSRVAMVGAVVGAIAFTAL